jgi:hypothetical protein
MPIFHIFTASNGKKVLRIEIYENFHIHLTWVGMAVATKNHFILLNPLDPKARFLHVDFRDLPLENK